MQYQGVLTKMQTEYQNPVQYYLVFEDSFIVRDLKVILGNDGAFFVSMPSRRSKFGTFRDIAHPLNSTMRNDIEKAVLAEYETVAKTIGEDNSASYDMED